MTPDVLQLLIDLCPLGNTRWIIHETAPWIITARHGSISTGRLGFWIMAMQNQQVQVNLIPSDPHHRLAILGSETLLGTVTKRILPVSESMTLELELEWWTETFYLSRAGTDQLGRRVISYRWATIIPAEEMNEWL